MTDGKTRIKITLAGAIVYYFDAWVGPMEGQDAIMGMDFMVPAGIHLDLGGGSICLPDEIRVQLSGRRSRSRAKPRLVTLDQDVEVPSGESMDIPLHLLITDHQKCWVTRGTHWVPAIMTGPGEIQYLRLTNMSGQRLILQRGARIGIWLAKDRVPRRSGFVSIGSRRYAAWQKIALEVTAIPGEPGGVEHRNSEGESRNVQDSVEDPADVGGRDSVEESGDVQDSVEGPADVGGRDSVEESELMRGGSEKNRPTRIVPRSLSDHVWTPVAPWGLPNPDIAILPSSSTVDPNEEAWITSLKNFQDLTADEVMWCGIIAEAYESDENGLRFYCPARVRSLGDRDTLLWLAEPFSWDQTRQTRFCVMQSQRVE